MQYKTGTVDVTNGLATVVGTGTAWLAEVSAGSIFTVQGSGVWYQVASVTDDTHLELSANWGGTTSNGNAYAITRDFTTNYGFPYPVRGDVDTAGLVQRAMEAIDAELDRIDTYIAGMNYP